MHLFKVDTGAAVVPAPPPLQGLTELITARNGQSNDTTHAELNYAASIGGQWDGTSVSVTNQRNAIGATMENMESDGIGFIWTKQAVGGQKLIEFLPGGAQYDSMVLKHNLLFDEYGKIDLMTMFLAESDAGAGTTKATFKTQIYSWMANVPHQPTVYMWIGPGNMADVPDAQEEAMREAIREVESEVASFVYVDLTEIPTDDDVNNHHFQKPATIQLVAAKIRTGILGLLGL